MRYRDPDEMHIVAYRRFYIEAISLLDAMGFSKDEIAYIVESADMSDSSEGNTLSPDFWMLDPDFNRAKSSDIETLPAREIEIPYSPEAMLAEVFRIANQRTQSS